MKGLCQHPLRVSARAGWLLGVIFFALLDYLLRCGFGAGKIRRARWLQRHSRRALDIFQFTARVSGPVPKNGLLVSNHLSYLDILVISAVTPAVFVSKADVRRWPVFGLLAALGGTVFVNRERRTQVGAVNREIQDALKEGALVVLFPEGTSSNGETVLPFKSSLLQPATASEQPLAAGWLHYAIDDGDAGGEVCYWGDHTFFPHLLNLLGKRTVRATVRFGQIRKRSTDRKELARQLHAEILQLKAGAGLPAR